MKKYLKMFAVVALFFSIFAFATNISEVSATAWNPATEITDANKGWDKTPDANVLDPTKTVMSTAISVIRVVGTGIAIIMLTYVAIKYMSAAPNEKADFKKSATAYVVGAVILFAATNILTVIANFATTTIK